VSGSLGAGDFGKKLSMIQTWKLRRRKMKKRRDRMKRRMIRLKLVSVDSGFVDI
jgi:hypothetical protein